MTKQEHERVQELIDNSSSMEEALRRIGAEMPHLGCAEVAHVFKVNAELLRMDAADQLMVVEGYGEIVELMELAKLEYGIEEPTLEAFMPVLAERAEQGDEQAIECLRKIERARFLISLHHSDGKRGD